jgi:predicted dehydrogenase
MKGCIIGLGRMGLTHFSIMNSHPDVEFVGACESSRFVGRNFQKYTGVTVYTDVERMLDYEKPEFVVVATPSASHVSLASVAIDRGIHTFVEKPFCLSPSDGAKVVDKLENTLLTNQVGYVNRFNEVFVEVKRHLEQKLIGDLVSFHAEMHGRTVLKDMKRSNWRGGRQTGGGCLYEFASHCVDLVHYLVGPPDQVRGSAMRSIYSTEVEDAVCSMFFYNNGLVGNISVNWSDESFRKAVNCVELLGTKGKILADKHAYKVYLRDGAPEVGFDKGWTIRYITDFAKPVRFYVRGNEFTNQLDSFVDSIKTGDAVAGCTFADGLRTDMTLEKIRIDSES